MKINTGGKFPKMALMVFLVACICYILWLVEFRLYSPGPGGFYGWQTEAFALRQLPLRMVPNPQLAALTNPYEGSQNAAFRVLDASYYKGRYYSYFGIGPILILTLPWRLATHSYLTEPGATALFVIGTFAVDLLLLARIRGFLFPESRRIEIISGYLLVTMGSYCTILLVGSNSGAVAQSGAYFCFSVALYCVLLSLTGRSPMKSLAGASLFCGLAIACRPSFVPAMLMLVPPTFLRRKDPKHRASAPGKTACALFPCAVIGAGLMYYNFLRFDSVWEFGNRFQLTNVDYRQVALLTTDSLWSRLVSFVVAPFALIHFFPFIAYGHDAAPIGIIWACPASLLTIGLCSYFAPAYGTLRQEAAAFTLGLGLAFCGVLVFLAAYLVFLFHYETDFLVPWVWLVVMGWYGTLSRDGLNTISRRWVSIAGTALCCASATIATLYTLSATDVSRRIPAVATAVNRAVDKLDALRGVSYGGIRLAARFPPVGVSGRFPLLVTGDDHNDLVYADVHADGSVQMGYYHAGLGGPLSDRVALDPTKSHEVDIYMGSLLPPPAHPFFDGWSPHEVFRAKKTFEIDVDGQKIYSCLGDFYEASPGSVLIGRNPHVSDVADGRFIGDISKVKMLPYPRHRDAGSNGKRTGSLTIELGFPVGRESGTEPLLSTGVSGRGDLVFVSYHANGAVTFGLDHWGRAFESPPVSLAGGEAHLVTINANSLAELNSGCVPFELFVDSKAVFEVPIQTYDSRPEDVYVGINAVGSSVSGPMFGGTVLKATQGPLRPSGSLEPLPAGIASGFVSVDVLFDQPTSDAGQPLLVVGRAGAADFVYLVRRDADHLQFAFDHWGYGGAIGRSLRFDPKRWHTIQIYLGSLRSLGSGQMPKDKDYRVVFDSQLALSGEAEFFPASIENIFIGKNPIGGSTTGLLFSGKIRLHEGHP